MLPLPRSTRELSPFGLYSHDCWTLSTDNVPCRTQDPTQLEFVRCLGVGRSGHWRNQRPPRFRPLLGPTRTTGPQLRHRDTSPALSSQRLPNGLVVLFLPALPLRLYFPPPLPLPLPLPLPFPEAPGLFKGQSPAEW